MNVFDCEMGPLVEQGEAQRILCLLGAGLTIEEYRAWELLTWRNGQVN
jgi:hypothetical protein